MTDRIDFEQVREVVRIATESDVTELEVETPSLKIKVRRAASSESQPAGESSATAHATPPAGAGVAASRTGQPVAVGTTTPPHDDHMAPIVAPMVGTFYRAASPDAPPFIKEGDAVDEGQVVCIIEAMKLFNEIQAEVRGRIARVLVDNASPVEYGQPLFVVDTAALA
jgi:acetyl-CoA carboxylase biotin carboxyl carrier protein